MRFKTILIALFITVFTSAHAQPAADTTLRTIYSANNKAFASDNLFLLGKVWGFLKYYHPNIAAGKYNWDKELVQFLPNYAKVHSVKERSDSLEAWIGRFGKIPVCASCNDNILTNAKLKPDFAWMNANNFSPSLLSKLKFIQNNRIQKGQYYTKFQSEDGVNIVQFQHEDAYNNLKFPNDSYALLAVFRFWNVIEYWYPYKYNLPVDWDSVLKQSIQKMLLHKDAKDYTEVLEEMITAIHDSHGYFKNAVSDEMKGKYFLPFTVKMVQDKLLITSILHDSLAALSKIRIGDAIESIRDTAVPVLISRIAVNTPASNDAAFLSEVSYRITRMNQQQCNLSIRRNGKLIKTVAQNFIPKIYPPVDLNPPYFSLQKDSAFCMIGKDIGYINVGLFNRKDSAALKDLVKKTKSLIIDLRQNQDEEKGTGGGDIIAQQILTADNRFVKFSTLQPEYPGVFTMTDATNMGMESGSDAYNGAIIILINEQTMSVGEFLTMVFQKAKNARTLGATTAGADGNVVYITLPGGMFVQFSGLGVYYPDGSETQRVGIKPNIAVKQTVDGFQKNKDEQLLKAIDLLQKGK